jgi:hypothetical protein
VALSFYCFSGAGFWYFFIAASRKALDARFFSAGVTLGPSSSLFLWRRGVSSEPPPAKGEFASRPMVARLVRYGPVRQKKTFLEKGKGEKRKKVEDSAQMGGGRGKRGPQSAQSVP